jgi:hypothetical protein
MTSNKCVNLKAKGSDKYLKGKVDVTKTGTKVVYK